MEMYLRVKRFKTTTFLECSERDRVEDLRRRLAVILKEDASRLRLLLNDAVLQDGKTVAECGLQNEAIVHLVCPTESGEWEKVNIPPPEILAEEDGDEDDDDEGED